MADCFTYEISAEKVVHRSQSNQNSNSMRPLIWRPVR